MSDQEFYDDEDECLCEDADYDLITGFARCYDCGRAWVITDETRRSLVKLQEDYDKQCAIWDAEADPEPTSPVVFDPDDEIPF